MHAVFVPAGRYAPRKVSAAVAAAAILLCGCTADRVLGRPAPACRVNSVLYCELDIRLDVERCQCVRRGQLRDALGSLARR